MVDLYGRRPTARALCMPVHFGDPAERRDEQPNDDGVEAAEQTETEASQKPKRIHWAGPNLSGSPS